MDLKIGLAEMLCNGVIMDVIDVEQAKVAEDAGAVAVMALERVPSDIRKHGGVARMSDPEMIENIKAAVSIPVMAKCRIGHFAEAQILEAIGIDFIDESEVLTPADPQLHISKFDFQTPFVCGACNLGEALRRISEGAALIRTVQPVPSGTSVIPAGAVQGYKLDPELERESSSLHHYLVGELEIKKDDISGALKNLSKANELSSKPSPQIDAKIAELQLRSGKFDAALEESAKAVAAQPHNPQILSLHAGILEALDRTSEAVEYYTKAYNENPNSTEAAILLSSAYQKVQRSNDAVKILKKFLSTHPQDSTANFYLGRVYEQIGNLNEAEEYMNNAYTIQPDNSGLALELVRVLLKLERIEEAKAVCLKVIDKEPENKLARKVLGQLLVGQNKFDEALQHFQVLEHIPEEETEARMSIALIQIQRGDFPDAITELRTLLKKDRNYSDARYALGTALAGSGDPEGGAKELLKIPSDDRNFDRSRTYGAVLFQQAGDFDSAEKSIREAIEKNNKDITKVLFLAAILRQAGKPGKAKEVLEKAVTQGTRNDQLLFDYGMLCHDLGDIKKTREVMHQALTINPKNPDALNYLAYDIAEEGGDLSQALEYVNRALKIKPNDAYLLDTLGWIQFKQGRFADAKENLKKAAAGAQDDPVVLEHYGDALVKDKKMEEAIAIYDQVTHITLKDNDEGDAQRSIERSGRKAALLRKGQDPFLPASAGFHQ